MIGLHRVYDMSRPAGSVRARTTIDLVPVCGWAAGLHRVYDMGIGIQQRPEQLRVAGVRSQHQLVHQLYHAQVGWLHFEAFFRSIGLGRKHYLISAGLRVCWPSHDAVTPVESSGRNQAVQYNPASTFEA